MKEKFLGWVCPECLELNEYIEKKYQEFNTYRCDTKFNEELITDDLHNELDTELIKIEFCDCGCSTSNYSSEELEVWVDEEKKVLYGDFINELNEEEQQEFLEKNNLKDYKIRVG